MKFQIVTNNPYVRDEYQDKYTVKFMDCTYGEVLQEVLVMCGQGYQLLTHPLSGSVKPNETPYKSIMVSAKPGNVDPQSIDIMRKSLATYRKFPKLNVKWSDQAIEDFRLIDYTLISSAL